MSTEDLKNSNRGWKPRYPYVVTLSDGEMIKNRLVVMGAAREICYDESPIFIEVNFWSDIEALNAQGITHLVSALSLLCGKNDATMTIVLSEKEFLVLDFMGKCRRVKV